MFGVLQVFGSILCEMFLSAFLGFILSNLKCYLKKQNIIQTEESG